jgi:hypothetical protein
MPGVRMIRRALSSGRISDGTRHHGTVTVTL